MIYTSSTKKNGLAEFHVYNPWCFLLLLFWFWLPLGFQWLVQMYAAKIVPMIDPMTL